LKVSAGFGAGCRAGIASCESLNSRLDVVRAEVSISLDHHLCLPPTRSLNRVEIDPSHGESGCEGMAAIVEAEIGDVCGLHSWSPFTLPIPHETAGRRTEHVGTQDLLDTLDG